MSEQRYTVMMTIYGVLLLLSYTLYLVLSGEAKEWALIVALVTAITGLFRVLQAPYKVEKTEKTKESE